MYQPAVLTTGKHDVDGDGQNEDILIFYQIV